MSLLKNEVPKRPEESVTEAIENFGGSKEFELDAAVWGHSILARVFKSIHGYIEDRRQFPLDQLPSMQDYLAMKAREAEAAKATTEDHTSTFF